MKEWTWTCLLALTRDEEIHDADLDWIFRGFHEHLRRLSLRLPCPEDAEECIQDLFLRLWEGYRQGSLPWNLPGTEEELRRYFSSALHNRLFDRKKRAKQTSSLEDLKNPDTVLSDLEKRLIDSNHPETHLIAADDKAQAEKHVADFWTFAAEVQASKPRNKRLLDTLRLMFQRAYGDLSSREIAGHDPREVNAFEQAVSRAHRTLCQAITEAVGQGTLSPEKGQIFGRILDWMRRRRCVEE